jgi:hypothetical protein
LTLGLAVFLSDDPKLTDRFIIAYANVWVTLVVQSSFSKLEQQ